MKLKVSKEISLEITATDFNVVAVPTKPTTFRAWYKKKAAVGNTPTEAVERLIKKLQQPTDQPPA